MKYRYQCASQRKFLSEQLKTVMKRSRVLESELQQYGYDKFGEGSVGGRSASSHTLLSHQLHGSGRRTSKDLKNNATINSRMSQCRSLPALGQANSPPSRTLRKAKNTVNVSCDYPDYEGQSSVRGSSMAKDSRSSGVLHHEGRTTAYEPLLNPNAKSFDETQSKDHGVALAALRNKRCSSWQTAIYVFIIPFVEPPRN
jgi:hypothetical protein